MQYGHFDLENKEYIITKQDTPTPWTNYLGSPEYGAMVSNNGAGYSFVKSGANGRISRFRFNSMMALPGRYIYIRDNDTKDYWSATGSLSENLRKNINLSAVMVLRTQLFLLIIQI